MPLDMYQDQTVEGFPEMRWAMQKRRYERSYAVKRGIRRQPMAVKGCRGQKQQHWKNLQWIIGDNIAFVRREVKM